MGSIPLSNAKISNSAGPYYVHAVSQYLDRDMWTVQDSPGRQSGLERMVCLPKQSQAVGENLEPVRYEWERHSTTAFTYEVTTDDL